MSKRKPKPRRKPKPKPPKNPLGGYGTDAL
jgi:hypothetical protein